MPVKIRLMRIGAKKRPFYRIVAVDERNKRTGKYIELIGTYNPLTEPKDIIINQELLKKWTKQGAVLSDGFLRITKQAPQKPPRKPKKDKHAQEKPATQAPTPTSTPVESEVTPVEDKNESAEKKAIELESEQAKLDQVKPQEKQEETEAVKIEETTVKESEGKDVK